MGKRFLRSIVQPFQAVTVSAVNGPFDLPVNPLSRVLLTIQLTELAETAAGLYPFMFDFLNLVTAVQIMHKGENIIQGSLRDMAVLNAILAGEPPTFTKAVSAVSTVRSVTVPLNFSRVPYWHEEAFPPTSRGNLQIQFTAGAAPDNASAQKFQIEAVELIEDDPVRHLKYVTNSKTPTATGLNDFALPIGNDILGCLLVDTGMFGTAGQQRLWGQVKLLKDNIEQYYPNSDFETLSLANHRRMRVAGAMFDHVHKENLAAAYAQFALTDPQEYSVDWSPDQYGYLEFDPLVDGSYALTTAGAADVKLRANTDSGTALVAMKYIPVELVPNR